MGIDEGLFQLVIENVKSNWRKMQWHKEEDGIIHILPIPPEYYVREVLAEYLRQLEKKKGQDERIKKILRRKK